MRRHFAKSGSSFHPGHRKKRCGRFDLRCPLLLRPLPSTAWTVICAATIPAPPCATFRSRSILLAAMVDTNVVFSAVSMITFVLCMIPLYWHAQCAYTSSANNDTITDNNV